MRQARLPILGACPTSFRNKGENECGSSKNTIMGSASGSPNVPLIRSRASRINASYAAVWAGPPFGGTKNRSDTASNPYTPIAAHAVGAGNATANAVAPIPMIPKKPPTTAPIQYFLVFMSDPSRAIGPLTHPATNHDSRSAALLFGVEFGGFVSLSHFVGLTPCTST